MSKAQSIQNKLYKAYGKIGKTLGRDFDVYRPQQLTDPLTDGFLIDTKPASFSQDPKYNRPNDQGLSIWLCWIDGQLADHFDIQQGDYLYNNDTFETYFIASAQPHLPIRAIKTTNTINVKTSGYSDTGSGFAPGDTIVASNIPAHIMQPSSGNVGGGYIPTSSYGGTGLPNYVINLWDPSMEIKIGDAIVDDKDNRSQVLAVYQSDIGTKLITTAYNPS